MNPTSISLQKKLVALVILFLVLGHVMLFSATGVMAAQQFGSEFYFVIRQFFCSLIGIGVLVGFALLPYQFWAKAAPVLIITQLLLLGLTALTPLGHQALGATRWLKLGPFQFQPSELAKITLVIFIANALAKAHNTPPKKKTLAVQGGIVVGLLFLIFRQNDLGSTVLLGLALLGMCFIAGARISYVAGVLITGISFTIFALWRSEFRRRRLMAFLNPWSDPQGNGFQTVQSFLSFHSGKWFGTGIGNGNSKLFFLPEVHTDFIFALIGEELGYVGAIGTVLLFIYFAYLLFKASFHAKDAFGRYLGFGLSLIIIFQITVNLGGVTGLIPIKGLPLPFISWGRSALIVNLAMMGILLNIVRQSGIISVASKKG
jgi:cell division protein FtsW